MWDSEPMGDSLVNTSDLSRPATVGNFFVNLPPSNFLLQEPAACCRNTMVADEILFLGGSGLWI
ncbi:hypothetical protein JOC69_000146 [Heliobacterium gestii]|nr:hypothetical protein [Heliomicrobium gestii]